MNSDFDISEFQPKYRDSVTSVIVQIQTEEFGVSITAEEQPDLQQIPSFYQRGNGNFWIATVEGEVVGTIALLDIGNKQGALRKMFVRKEFRGKELGVAAALLSSLTIWARERGLQTIFLGTTSLFLAAHRFYEKSGFVRVEKSELPDSFPVMQVDSIFFKIDF